MLPAALGLHLSALKMLTCWILFLQLRGWREHCRRVCGQGAGLRYTTCVSGACHDPQGVTKLSPLSVRRRLFLGQDKAAPTRALERGVTRLGLLLAVKQ